MSAAPTPTGSGAAGRPATGAALPAGLAEVVEPLDLRDGWWAAERAGTPPPDLVGAVTAVVWAAWCGRLAGVDEAWLAAVTAGHRRELWLWLVGERTWEQALTSLAGRVGRRLPA